MSDTPKQRKPRGKGVNRRNGVKFCPGIHCHRMRQLSAFTLRKNGQYCAYCVECERDHVVIRLIKKFAKQHGIEGLREKTERTEWIASQYRKLLTELTKSANRSTNRLTNRPEPDVKRKEN